MKTNIYFSITPFLILLRIRNVSDESCCRENHNTYFMFSNFFSENRAVYEIMCKNMVQPDRSQMKIRRIPISCWIHKATNTHSEYVTLIAFLLQQWLREPTWNLHYTYIACLVFISNWQVWMDRWMDGRMDTEVK